MSVWVAPEVLEQIVKWKRQSEVNMSDEPTTVETPPEPAKVEVPNDIREIGLKKFNQAMEGTTRHISYAAQLLGILQDKQGEIREIVGNIQRWNKESEGKLKNVPTSMADPIRAIFKASQDELYSALREISEEMQMIDLDAEPPEEIAF